jgi:hypothetical protein
MVSTDGQAAAADSTGEPRSPVAVEVGDGESDVADGDDVGVELIVHPDIGPASSTAAAATE